MPNYVSNIVTIVGSDEQVKKVVDFVKSEKSAFDFNKIVPMPETFRKYDTTNYPEKYPEAVKEQQEKYGVVGWYDWSRVYWGTKWNACEPSMNGYGQFYFDTAWSAPLPVLKALSKQFPDVRVEFVYADEDSGYNTGKGFIENGEMYADFPDGGSNEAYELYLQTHEWARDEMHKDENGNWRWDD